jgi:putative transposase
VVIKQEQISIGRACRIMNITRSMWYYQSCKDDTMVENKLQELSEKLPTKGFWEYYGRIRNEGLKWNHKRIKRVYNKLGLNLRRKKKRRLPARVKQPLLVPIRMNQTWSMDFMQDSLESGRKFRCLNVIDDFNRECLAIEVDTSLSGQHVVRVLESIIELRGKPNEIRVDNGPEFISSALDQFCEKENITLRFIQPGRPMQNGFIERFNKSLRIDVLDAFIFENLDQVREVSEEWLQDYNLNHPHSSLGGMSPSKYLERAINLLKTASPQTSVEVSNKLTA